MSHSDTDIEDWELVPDHGLPSDGNAQANGRWVLYINFQMKHSRTRHNIAIGPFGTIVNKIEEQRSLERSPQDHRPEPEVFALQENSRFLSIPVEIRLYIYELLFRTPEGHDQGLRVRRRTPREPPSVLTILQTCRQVYFEAATIFYSINRLCISDIPAFVASLGSERRDAVERLTISCPSAGHAMTGVKQLHLLPNVKSLHLVRSHSVRYIRPSSWAVLANPIGTEISKHRLEDVKFITPGLENPTPDEDKRQARLIEIDQIMTDAIKNGSNTSS